MRRGCRRIGSRRRARRCAISACSHGALFVAVDVPGAPRLFPGRRLMRSHYLIWQALVLVWLRRRRRWFELVHHVTFVAAWFPPFAAFAGMPFVWGPIGTNPPMPEFYRARLKPVDRLRATLRTFVTQSLVRYNPVLPLVARRCVAAFAITEHVRGLLPTALRVRTRVHPAIGIADEWFEVASANRTRNDTMLFVGRAMCHRGRPSHIPRDTSRTHRLARRSPIATSSR